MSGISRRNWIVGGFAAAAGGAVAVKMAARYGLLPPDASGIYGPGTALTYAANRILVGNSPAREFSRSQISKPFVNGDPPKEATFQKLQSNGFLDWRLQVDGMVSRPATYSLADLKALPARSQITHLACEEGWSYISEWTGVPLAHVLSNAGLPPQARYVAYQSIQKDWSDFIDIAEALHPQTLIAYGLNGGDLPVGNGGPLRLRVPRQLGYKSVKYITRITVTDRMPKFAGDYSWYAGI